MNYRWKIVFLFSSALALYAILFLFYAAAAEDRFQTATNIQEYYRANGSFYIFVSAATLACSLVAIFFLTLKGRLALAILPGLAFGLSFFALVSPIQFGWYANYYAEERVYDRMAHRLEGELNQVHKFKYIRLEYFTWPRSKGSYVYVTGDVSGQRNYDELVNRIEKADDWLVIWGVTINGRRPVSSD